MKDNLFEISFRKLALWYLPTFLRKILVKSFIWILIYPLELMYIEFLKARKQNLIKMSYNFQKYSLQKHLNDRFDKIQRRIRIVKAVQYEGIYLFTEGEDDASHSKTKWLHGDEKPIYIRNESELHSDLDFIVKVPDINISIPQLKAEIDFHVLQSKNYQIEIIN